MNSKYLIIFFTFLSFHWSFSQSDCANATPVLTIPFSETNTTCGGGNSHTWTDYACAELDADDGEDYVYSITPAANTDIVLTVDGAISSASFGWAVIVTEGCPTTGNCVASDDESQFGVNPIEIRTSLSAGVTYYITIDSEDPGCESFDISIEIPPANDECTGAINVPVSAVGTGCSTVLPGTVFNASESSEAAACGDGSNITDDVWYSFTATSTAHDVSMQNVVGSDGDMRWTVYSGGCGSLIDISCGGTQSWRDNPAELTGLTVGNTYIIRAYSADWQPSDETFELCVSTKPPPPANDECTNRIGVPVSVDPTCTSTLSATVNGATESSENGCFSTGYEDDVWFEFTATAANHGINFSNIVDNSGGGYDEIRFDLYEGSTCANASFLDAWICDYDVNSSGDANIGNVTPGTNYIMRVFTSATTAVNLDFDVCITSPPPSNDLCAGATSLVTNVPVSDENRTASGDGYCAGDGSGNSTNQNNRWYTWEADPSWTPNDSIFFTLIPTNCMNGDGLEYTVFRNIDCNGLEVSPCTYANVADFINNFGLTSQSHDFRVNPGENFLINVDGYFSDECDYTIIAATDSCATSIDLTTDGSNCSLGVSITSPNGPFDITVRDSLGNQVAQWLNSAGVESQNNLNAGDYELSVVNDDGCESIVTATVDCNCTPPVIDAFPDTAVCETFTFPTPTGTLTGAVAYFSEPNGGGTQYAPGATYSTVGVDTFYIYDVTVGPPSCAAQEPFELTIVNDPEITNPGDTALCGNFTLPVITGPNLTGNEGYYTGPGGTGTSYTDGDIISATTLLYIYDSTTTAPFCSDEVSFNITITSPPVVSPIADTSGICDTYTLPSITGTDLTGATLSYYTGAGGTGTAYAQGASFTTVGTTTLYARAVNGSCNDEVSFDVTINATPVSDAGTDQILTCSNPNLLIGGSNSTPGLVYEWTGPSITGPTDSTHTFIDMVGTYSLRVYTLDSACFSDSAITVTSNLTLPNADAGLDITLLCSDSTQNLSGSSPSANTEYAWTTNTGTILSGDSTLTPLVADSGAYFFTVTDTITGCVNADTVLVTSDFYVPNLNPSSDTTINCNTTSSIWLYSADTNSSRTFTYSWSHIGGNIVGPSNRDSVEVDAAGDYTVFVTDVNSLCDTAITITVALDTISPIAQAGSAIELSCATSDTLLNGTGSSTVDVSYNWTGGSVIADGTTLAPRVDAAATYYLTVTDTTNGCTAIDSVEVTSNNIFPTADAGADQILSCSVTNVVLDGSASVSNNSGNLTHAWSFVAGGNIVSGGGTDQATVNAADAYVLAVTDDSNDCLSRDTVLVTMDTIAPIANAGLDQFINCVMDTVTLDGTGSSLPGDSLTYLWTGGTLITDSSLTTVDTETAATYTLLVTDTTNGCFNTDQVVVGQDVSPVVANAGSDLVLSCAVSSVTLDGSNSTDNTMGRPNVVYNWSIPTTGNIVGATDQITASADAVGTYVLLVQDTVSQCAETDTVEVTSNSVIPTANAGIDTLINCYNPTISIGDTATSNGATITYAWSVVAGGGFVGLTSNEFATVNGAGTYRLLVTDTDNGCTAADTVVVTDDLITPTAEAGGDQTITCAATTVTLNGAGSSVGPNIVYDWYGGNIVSDDSTLNPVVNQVTDYIIAVIDTTNGCTATDTVNVLQDNSIPSVDAGLDITITCGVDSVLLQGDTTGTNLDIFWTTGAGNILSDDTLINIWVDQAGVYTLNVEDTISNCSNTSDVEVFINQINPVLQIDSIGAGTLTCDDTQVDLIVNLTNNGFSDGTVGDTLYTWSTPDGNITSATNTNLLSVDASGTYQIIVQSDSTNCIDSTSITIAIDTNVAAVIVPDSLWITCNASTQTQTIDGGGSTPTTANLDFQWSTTNGAISSGGTLPIMTTTTDGTYILEVTNTDNGCIDTDSVVIVMDTIPPVANAGPDTTLSCTTPSLIVGDASTTTGASINYSWLALLGGAIDSTSNTQQTRISTPGTYRLTVTNTSNSCVSQDETVIDDIQFVVTANAGPAQVDLTCANDSLVDLDGSNSSSLPSIIYTWTTTTGSIEVGTENLATATAEAPGMYYLRVEDTISGCFNTDSVLVNDSIYTINVVAGVDTFITCANPQITLDGGSSDGSGSYTFDWTAIVDGRFITNPTGAETVVVDTAGTYVLQVTNPLTQCFGYDTVMVADSTTISVVADAGPSDTLTCSTTTLNIGGPGTSTGASYTHLWSLQNGSFTGIVNNNQPVATVSAAETYRLVVTHSLSQCRDTSFVVIETDTLRPATNVNGPFTLNCYNLTIVLDADSSASNGDFTYWWTPGSAPTGGNIVSGDFSLNPTIDLAGTFVFNVRNNLTDCTNDTTITVIGDTAAVIVTTVPNVDLDCNTSSAQLNGNGSDSGIDFVNVWTANNGSYIQANANSLTPLVDTTSILGTTIFTLTVTDTTSGCTASSDVTVTENIVYPVADAGPQRVINCINTTVMLDGRGSTPGALKNWTGPAPGAFVDPAFGTTSDEPEVNQGGTYTLEVSSANGCVSSDDVQVTDDIVYPTAEAGPDREITCDNLVVNLDGTGSSTGVQYTYQWTSSDGNFASATNGTTTTADLEGLYELTVVNLDNGCFSSDVVNVTGDLSTLNLITSTAPSGCEGGSPIDLTTSVNIQGGTWDGIGINDPAIGSFDPLVGPGSYRVGYTVYNPVNNCPTTDSVDVIINPDPIVSISTGDNPCFGTINVLTAAGPESVRFTWYDGTTGQTHLIDVPEGTQTYTVFGVDALTGCRGSGSITIKGVNPTVDIFGLNTNATYPYDASLTSITEEVDSYSWIVNGEEESTFSDMNYTFMRGENEVILIGEHDESGCADTMIVRFELTTPATMYIPNVFTPGNQDGVNDAFRLPFNMIDGRLIIYDRWGQAIRTITVPDGEEPVWDGLTNSGEVAKIDVYIYKLTGKLMNGKAVDNMGQVTILR